MGLASFNRARRIQAEKAEAEAKKAEAEAKAKDDETSTKYRPKQEK